MRRWCTWALCLTLAGGVSCRSTETNTAADPQAQPSSASASAGPAQPEYVDVTVPAGTTLLLRLDTPVASDTSRLEQAVLARLSRGLVIDGRPAVPEGSIVSGVVARVERSGRAKGRAHIGLRFGALQVGEQRYDIHASLVQATAPSTKKNDAEKIGIPAAGGALVGALVGGGKGAAIGAGVGGGAGTAYVLSTRGEEVRLDRGARLSITLTMPLHVRIATTPRSDEHQVQRL